MTAIYGLVGDFTFEQLNAIGERLGHRGAEASEWSPAAGVWLGQRGAAGGAATARQAARTVADAGIFNRDELETWLGIDSDALPAALLEALLEQQGPERLARVNGDYALGSWDNRRQRLLLARSPLGARALYFWQSDAGFAFASEYKGLFGLEAFEPAVDREALQQLQGSWYLPPGRTLLSGVDVLAAGVYLVVGGGETVQRQFWKIAPGPTRGGGVEVEAEFRRKFVQAVRRRSTDLVNVGIELSGGIDSAAIVAVLRHLYPERPLSTFTIGTGPDDPEILAARTVAQEFDSEHHETFFGPERLPELLPTVVWHLEDPIGRTETVLYYQLMMEAARHVDVVLGGYASDGLYAGMPKHKLVRLIQRLPIVDTGLEEFYHYTQTSRPPQSLLGRGLHRLYYGASELPMPRVHGTSLEPVGLHLKREKSGLLNRVLQQSVMTSVPNWMPKVEKPHAAFNVEVRIPYTDIDLVEYSFRLPENLKMRRLQDKYILRKALLPLLPEAIARRPKYPQRMEYDLSLSRALDEMASLYLDPEDVSERGFFVVQDIQALRHRPAGTPYSGNRAMRLWTAIGTEIWARTYLDDRARLLSPSPAPAASL